MFWNKMFSRAFGACALAALLVAPAAHAQAIPSELKVATITYWAPYESKDPATNKLVGFDIDLFEAIAAKMGVKVSWVETSFDQIMSWNIIKTKRADVVISGLVDLPQHHAHVDLIDYIYENQVFFTLKTNASRVSNWDALCGKTIAVTRSAVFYHNSLKTWNEDNCLKAGKPGINIMGTENTANSRLQLNQGRADATVSGQAVLDHVNKVEGDRYVAIGKPFLRTLYGIGYEKGNTVLGDAIKKGLTEVIADGTYQKIHRKWKLPEGTGVDKPIVSAP